MQTGRNLFRLALLLLTASALLANGGSWEFGVPGTGSAAATEQNAKTDVTIDDEHLEIDLHQEFAAVEVRYTMRNTGAAVDQPFFFPVEKWQQDLDDYRIEVDGRLLIWEPRSVQKAPAKENVQTMVIPPKPTRTWKHSVIPFGAGQVRRVMIRYRSKHAAAGESWSDDTLSGATTFAYAFSPASTWKNPIQKGTVIINVRTAIPELVSVERPKGRFRPDGPSRLKWEFTNLRPTLDDDLKVLIEPSFNIYPRRNRENPDDNSGQRYRIEKARYFLEHTDYSVSASSTLSSTKPDQYAAENVRNLFGHNKSAWAEGVAGDGIGESLTIKSQRPMPLAAILIMPGFRNREAPELWDKNNRVAGLQITLNGEYTFDATIPDEQFKRLYPIPIRGYDKPVETLRLVITAVHRGTQHRDTCISAVGLRAKLAKKPTLQPAR